MGASPRCDPRHWVAVSAIGSRSLTNSSPLGEDCLTDAPQSRRKSRCTREGTGMRLWAIATLSPSQFAPTAETCACERTHRRRTALSNAQSRSPVTTAQLVNNPTCPLRPGAAKARDVNVQIHFSVSLWWAVERVRLVFYRVIEISKTKRRLAPLPPKLWATPPKIVPAM